MKLSKLAISLCNVALGVSVLTSVPALAQTSPSSPGVPDTTIPDSVTPDTTIDDEDDDFNWGWLGLVGLLGLAGLTRKPETRTEYRDPRTTSVDPSNRPDYRP
ncbi:MAG: WGxxGxxG-CTERM domain-containing protein [Pegethrix bostrychoides GSE-TBD4-15B]|uniref:WGxxGxxG-CTERM domain-containing protein n=1 Tax=Pegethrix bostrychoides GSE-TBD4-15B TaxID=2839662 RepID=A0A951U3R8_9CYAN|nr:WGxxGxxG-CTERM domain-containing protein [Pegethrix bostrychoides GSE-TBD4-15B]